MNATTQCASPAAKRAVSGIKAEHRALARILGAMQLWVAHYRDAASPTDLALFEAMLRYIEEVPDRLHHPREDAVLFPAVAAHECGRELVTELEREHAYGTPMLNELRRAYEALRQRAPNALNQLSSAVDEFAEFYWLHMRKEEQQLLPLAEDLLSAEQWERVESAFCNESDPLFGAAKSEKYRMLYRYISSHTQGPLKGFIENAAP